MQQIGFQFPLVERLLESQEIEDVRVFERLLDKVGLRRRQQPLEVGDGLVPAEMGLGLDHRAECCGSSRWSSVCRMYQRRVVRSLTFSIRTM